MSYAHMRQAAGRIEELEEVMEALIYWNDEGYIDESWWKRAKELVKYKDEKSDE